MNPVDFLVATFLQEATESVDELGRCLEALRDATDAAVPDLMTSAMRVAHNLKGASLSVGARELGELCHGLEDTLEAARACPERPSEGSVNGWVSTLVTLSTLVRSPALRAVVEAAAVRLNAPLAVSSAPSQPPPAGEALGSGPSAAAAEPAAEPPAGEAGPDAAAAASRDRGVRVDASRLSDVMVSADEIRIAHARGRARLDRVRQFLVELEQLSSSAAQLPRRLSDLSAVWTAFLQDETREVHELGKLASTLSHAVRRLTMLPLATEQPSWRGTVREAASELGKRARLEVDVGLIELDKAIIDRLREPLGHLLRNAVDHGLEAPAERAAAGKPPLGRVGVRANAEGAFVRVEVDDDGRGLDRERIAAIAVSRGLVTAEARARLSEAEAVGLLFLPGFSTADRVSRISGRGVGLHAVKSAVDALGGTISVRAGTGGSGTTFELLVPVTQISVSGLLVRAGQSVYALPVNDVARVASAREGELARSAGEVLLRLAGEAPIRVRRLESTLGLVAPELGGHTTMVIVERGAERLALAVDELLGELEYVTRPFPWNVTELPGLSGAVILGDGSLALAVDVGALLAGDASDPAAAAPFEDRAPHRARILVVDDSVVTRTLARGTLAAAGYEVVLAVDGEDAWSKLRNERFAVVVTDVQMPRLDGFGLTERIRRDPRLKALPVVLVTSLGESHHVERGAAVGADAYVVKGQLEQRRLLDAVHRLLERTPCPAS